jgi:hypothetical protein
MSYYPTKYSQYPWIKEKKYTIHDLMSICDFFKYSIKRKPKKRIIRALYSGQLNEKHVFVYKEIRTSIT